MHGTNMKMFRVVLFKIIKIKILTMFKTAHHRIRSRDKIQPIPLHEICLISNIFPPNTNSWNYKFFLPIRFLDVNSGLIENPEWQ
jgi:hypothetical protein